VRALLDGSGPPRRLVVVPVVNPDGLARNLARLGAGRPALRRCNASGVDLNRNFPRVPGARSLHPFSGSGLPFSPHFRGPHPLSEPESRAVAALARDERPALSLAFHSFGGMLLYPYAHRRGHHPREAEYLALGAAFTAAQRRPYRVMPSFGLYPVIGDFDDWLDLELGALAFTVEVGRLDGRLLDPRRALQPFWWMNPTQLDDTVDDVAPAAAALVRAPGRAEVPAPGCEAAGGLRIAAR
jgi:hypothetical protein